MGNVMTEPKKKPLTIHDLTVKVSEYKTIHEGDPEMKEDPEFPLHMMYEAMDNNNTIDGNAVKGTYVYYPNKNKPKMWIGNYKILNPEDILSKDIAAKIGMTEAQWKKYIEYKKNGTSMQEGFGDFDYLTAEQKEALSKHWINGATPQSYDEYGNEIELNESSINVQGFHEMEFYEHMRHNDQHQLSHEFAKRKIKQNPEQQYDEFDIERDRDFATYNKNIYTNDMMDNVYDQADYINRLNEEANRIRQEQEEEIYQQQKDLMYYSSLSMGNGTDVSKLSNNMLPQTVTSPIEFIHDKDFEYIDEDELANFDEKIQMLNYNNELSKIRHEGYGVDENEEEEVEEEEEDAEDKEEKETEEEEEEKEEVEEAEQVVAKTAEQWKKQKLSLNKELTQDIQQQKKTGKEKDMTVKAKVNSYWKNNNSSRVAIIPKINPYKSVRSLGTMSTKSSIGVNQSKISLADKNKNMKNAKLKKNAVTYTK